MAQGKIPARAKNRFGLFVLSRRLSTSLSPRELLGQKNVFVHRATACSGCLASELTHFHDGAVPTSTRRPGSATPSVNRTITMVKSPAISCAKQKRSAPAKPRSCVERENVCDRLLRRFVVSADGSIQEDNMDKTTKGAWLLAQSKCLDAVTGAGRLENIA